MKFTKHFAPRATSDAVSSELKWGRHATTAVCAFQQFLTFDTSDTACTRIVTGHTGLDPGEIYGVAPVTAAHELLAAAHKGHHHSAIFVVVTAAGIGGGG
jgi:hypothetical protein